MDAAGDAASQEAVAPLFCNLCFARDHRRSTCPLVMPAAVAVGAPAVHLAGEDSEEEEDPEEPPFEGGDFGDAAAPPAAAAADFLPLPPANVEGDAAFPVGDGSEEEEDPEELIFEDEDGGGAAAPANAAAEDFLPLPPPEVEDEETYLPIVDAAVFLASPGQGSGAPSSNGVGDSLDLQEPTRPDHVDVFMPFVNLRHFDHIAYAFINPTSAIAVEDPDAFIHQAADLGCGPDRVTLYPSAAGSRVAVFATDNDREHAVANGPFLGREASVYFRRHDETDQRFVFEHEAMAALSISHFPFEQWQRHHITHSSGPYANPHNIDPVCLTGVDFQAVLVTVKAESITDIPLNLAVKNYCSIGTFCEVSIIDFEELATGSDNSFGPDLEEIPDAASSVGDEAELVDLPGGTAYPDMMELLGVPPPLVPHGAPHGAAPAAPAGSLVDRALANAPPLPSVRGGAILSKPKSVQVKLRLGYFDVLVTGSAGERASFRLPLRKKDASPGCKGLLVANFISASVGVVDSISLVGPLRRPVLSVDVLARIPEGVAGAPIPLEVADALVNGVADLPPVPTSSVVDAAKGLPLDSLCPSPAPPSPTSPGKEASLARPSPVQVLALETSPVEKTLWHSSPTVRQPRRCSRLAQGRYVSIVERAIARKRSLLDGAIAETSRRQGELSADDLLAVAIDEGREIQAEDIAVLAQACDIPVADLQLAPGLSVVTSPFP
ncbi:hypothetical protein QYE76_049024 [Lolium multiflorum]|uniref:Uncharacterized protein n=1 Tax=Lolium multiflorum TaxID=4521 RepID=A0AAD8WHX6_LOLMU|nr:hypothetical protein QYE76_049024 [Lolium multiflorum]